MKKVLNFVFQPFYVKIFDLQESGDDRYIYSGLFMNIEAICFFFLNISFLKSEKMTTTNKTFGNFHMLTSFFKLSLSTTTTKQRSTGNTPQLVNI